MAYRKQLKDAQEDTTITGVTPHCPTSKEFRDVINKAQRMLTKRGDWFGTVWLAQFCIHGCRIAWPRYVGTILAARPCRGAAMQLFNNWYSFISPYSGFCSASGLRDWGASAVLQDDNPAPTFNDITGASGKLIRYHVVKRNDLGKKITLYGKAYGAQPLQEKDSNGVWQNGLTLTAQAPFASTSIAVTQIGSIIRDVTEGMAYLYEYDPITDLLRDLAVFEPNETHPQYRRSLIRNYAQICGSRDAYGVCQKQIDALVSLEFIEAVHERDFLLIDDFDALAFAIEAVKAGQAKDVAMCEAKLLEAVRELNFTDRKKSPDKQIPVSVNWTGSDRIVTNMI